MIIFCLTVVNKLAIRGYQPHLHDLLLRLNFNNYYAKWESLTFNCQMTFLELSVENKSSHFKTIETVKLVCLGNRTRCVSKCPIIFTVWVGPQGFIIWRVEDHLKTQHKGLLSDCWYAQADLNSWWLHVRIFFSRGVAVKFHVVWYYICITLGVTMEI